MPWSPVQRQRLEFEKAVLDKYWDDRVSWRDPTGNARVEVRVVLFKWQRVHSSGLPFSGLPCFLFNYDSVIYSLRYLGSFLCFDAPVMKEDDPRLQFSLYSAWEGIEGLTCIFFTAKAACGRTITLSIKLLWKDLHGWRHTRLIYALKIDQLGE